MAQDVYLKIEGITGESNQEGHVGDIELLNWSWGVYQPSSMAYGSGGGAGKAMASELTFEHYMDRASPALLNHCLTAKHIGEVTLVERKAGGNPLAYVMYTLNDVVVTMVNVQRAAAGNETPVEAVSLAFAKINLQYTIQDDKGNPAGVASAGYDFKVGKPL